MKKIKDLFWKFVEKVNAWIREERRKEARRIEYERDCRMAMEKKCLKCKTKSCIWMSGYCPE